jgi:hypothetical protein
MWITCGKVFLRKMIVLSQTKIGVKALLSGVKQKITSLNEFL